MHGCGFIEDRSHSIFYTSPFVRVIKTAWEGGAPSSTDLVGVTNKTATAGFV